LSVDFRTTRPQLSPQPDCLANAYHVPSLVVTKEILFPSEIAPTASALTSLKTALPSQRSARRATAGGVAGEPDALAVAEPVPTEICVAVSPALDRSPTLPPPAVWPGAGPLVLRVDPVVFGPRVAGVQLAMDHIRACSTSERRTRLGVAGAAVKPRGRIAHKSRRSP
jgi:hypothetical protein